MLQARSGFGCCVTNDSIYTAGGLSPGKQQAISNCEVYNISENKWHQLPNLPVGTFSLSLSIYNKNNLLAVGGTDDQKRHLTTIWMLGLLNISKWQRINVTLVSPLTSAGLTQNREGRIVIFGGWHLTTQNSIFVLKETPQGFQILKSKCTMEKPDLITFNGAFSEQNGDILLQGQEHVHRMIAKTHNIRWERQINQH